MKILICITFHYNKERLKYLKKVIKGFINITKYIDIYIVTNTHKEYELSKIKQCYPFLDKTKKIITKSFVVKGNPHNLIMCHKIFLNNEFIKYNNFTHFLHTEDDMLFNKYNFNYWLKYRKLLFKYKNVPSFFRVERVKQKSKYKSTDVGFRILWSLIPKRLINNYFFINMPNPSQSNYLVDKNLAREMLIFPPNIKRHFYLNSNIGIRETIDIGPIFSEVPKFFISKNLVPIHQKSKKILKDCLIEHLPANYESNINSNLGKINIDKLIYYIPLPNGTFLRNIKYYLYVQIINVIKKIF